MKTLRLALLAAGLATVLTVPAARGADKAPPRNVDLAVTDAGLVPAELKVTKGQPVHLGITRKTDRTCMTEVVISDVGVKQALPLNKTVYADFTPSRSGTFRILCGMGMEFGKLVVN